MDIIKAMQDYEDSFADTPRLPYRHMKQRDKFQELLDAAMTEMFAALETEIRAIKLDAWRLEDEDEIIYALDSLESSVKQAVENELDVDRAYNDYRRIQDGFYKTVKLRRDVALIEPDYDPCAEIDCFHWFEEGVA